MTAVKAVLLDFGHTLVNYEADEAALLESYRDIHAFLGDAGVSREPISDDLMMQVFRRLTGVITQSYIDGQIEELDCLALYDDAFRHLGYQLDRDLLHRVIELDHRALASQFEVPGSTLTALSEIQQRGYKVGIVSNATPTGEVMRHDLQVLGLASLVDAAAYSSEVGFRKPDPRIYLAVIEALGVHPKACVFVGDRVKEDVNGAQALGMRAVLSHEFRQEEVGSAKPLAVIRRFPELLSILDSLADGGRGRCREGALPGRPLALDACWSKLALERLPAWERPQDQEKDDCSEESHQNAPEEAVGSEAENRGREPSAEQGAHNSNNNVPQDAVPAASHHHASQPAGDQTDKKKDEKLHNCLLGRLPGPF